MYVENSTGLIKALTSLSLSFSLPSEVNIFNARYSLHGSPSSHWFPQESCPSLHPAYNGSTRHRTDMPPQISPFLFQASKKLNFKVMLAQRGNMCGPVSHETHTHVPLCTRITPSYTEHENTRVRCFCFRAETLITGSHLLSS